MSSERTLEGGHSDKEKWMQMMNQMHFSRTEMNSLIMDYLVAEGFKEAAEKFSLESGIQPKEDLDELDKRIKIRDAIQNGKLIEAMSIVNNYYPELLDTNPRLFFLLHQQHLIELIREGKIMDAIEYAHSTMSEQAEQNPELRLDLEKTLALLAFEKPETSPFGDLLRPAQRQRVASELNAAVLEMEDKANATQLTMSVKQLYWAQDVLEKQKVSFPILSDLTSATFQTGKLT